jgi:hypothetical protein
MSSTKQPDASELTTYHRIEELEAQVAALQDKVHLCAGYDALEKENKRLRKALADLLASGVQHYHPGTRCVVWQFDRTDIEIALGALEDG